MALPGFYNVGDQAIYSGGEHFIPQEKYRLGYKAPLPTSETETVTQGFGIPYTNAFTGGGPDINTGGNAFGYGTAVKPVSYGQYGQPGYSGGLPGDVQQTGTGRNMMADIDPNYDPNDPNSQWMSSKEYLTGKRRQLPAIASLALSAIPWAGNWIRGKIENRMNDPRLGQGSYRVGGMDYNQKGLYDSLASGNMLFEGSTGLKTLTGKNFMGKGYLEGQLELAKGFGFENMTEEEMNAAIAAEAARHSQIHKGKGFKWKQMKEAKAVYNKNKALGEKDWAAEHAAKQEAAAINTLGPDNPLIGKIDHTGGGGHGSITRDPGSKVEGAPTHSTRDDLMARGGRAGYNRGRVVNPGGYQGDEFEDENTLEFMQDQGIPHSEMAEASPFELRIEELMDTGMCWEEAYQIASEEFATAERPEESFSEEGIASIV